MYSAYMARRRKNRHISCCPGKWLWCAKYHHYTCL